MQSQSYFGSDSMIHSLLMRFYNRQRLAVHAACNSGTAKEASASLKALEKVPDLHLRPTKFGPTVNSLPKLKVLKNIFTQTPPALVSLTRLAWYVKKHQIKIIHGTEKPRDAFYGVILAKLTGAKSVIHLHVGYDDWISPLVRWALRHADGIIGVSEFVAKSVVANGYSASKVYYVLNSLDATRWNPDTEGSHIRQEYNIGPDVPVLAIISRLFPWKGHTELLKALAKLKEQTSNFKLLIVGEDDPRATPGGGSYLGQLKELTRQLGLEEQIIFTGFRRDVAQLLAACDIYVMPSFEEPCAVAFLEAMAMRKPVVALDSGGTAQLVDHGKAGLLSQPQDIEQLMLNIKTLLDDPQLRRQMGQYARQRVVDYYNPQRLADETEQIYRQILGRR